jgi:hypothetical protein
MGEFVAVEGEVARASRTDLEKIKDNREVKNEKGNADKRRRKRKNAKDEVTME